MPRIFLLLALLTPLLLAAQSNENDVFDTARRANPNYADREYFIRNAAFNRAQDSSMLFLQQYDQTKKDNMAVQNLGDVHTPFIKLLYSHPQNAGFNAGMRPFLNLYFLSDSARFYNAWQPYSEFSYAQGSGGKRGMIDFDAFHTQNFGKRFNYTVQYHSTANDGFYLRQTISLKNLRFSSHYSNRSRRYSAMGIVTWNKTNFMENGGILQNGETDSLFKSLPPKVRLVNVSLNQAANVNRQREYVLRQIYRFKNRRDSGSGNLAFSHEFSAVRLANYYTDKAGDFAFYDGIYKYNSSGSSDSFNSSIISNSAEIFTPLRQKGFSFRAGIAYEQITAFQSANPLNYLRWINHNLSTFGSMRLRKGRFINPELQFRYYLSGYSKSMYSSRAENTFSPDRRGLWHLSTAVESSIQNTDYLQAMRKSNHYNWMNGYEFLGGSSFNTLSLGLWKKTSAKTRDAFRYTLPPKSIDVRILYSDISNLFYYDSSSRPAFTGKHENLLQLSGSFHISLNKLQLHQDLALQQLSDGLKTAMQLPAFISRSSLYYQNYLFKKATFIQTGIEVVFTSSYRAGLYNPALQSFVSSTREVGGYPVFDVFINAEVKTARIFFKIEHFNQDLLPQSTFSNYMFASPYQPYAPRRFRLGFTWKFFY